MAPRIRRGDIWLVDFDPTEGHEQKGVRPAVVINSDRMEPEIVELAFVVPCTRTERFDRQGILLPNHIPVDATDENGLTAKSYFLCEQTRSVSTKRFDKRLGKLDSDTMERISDVLLLLLDL